MESPPEFCFLFINSWVTCMAKAEWATWAQAVFSAVAIYAAIRVAVWQQGEARRHQQQVQKAGAEVIADTIAMQNGQAIGMLKGFRKRWGDEFAAAGRLAQPSADLHTLRQLVEPTDEQLLHLAPIWPNATRLLAVARNMLITLRRELEYQVAQVDLGDVDEGEWRDMIKSVDVLVTAMEAVNGLIRPTLEPMSVDSQ